MASRLISKNENRTLGPLVHYEKNSEGLVQIIQWKEFSEEMNGIVQIIRSELASGLVSAQDILVLAPRRRIGYRLRDELMKVGVPVKSYFRESAIDSDEVKRAYSLLQFLVNPKDMISFRYLLGYGSSSYRSRPYKLLQKLAKEDDISVIDLLEKLDNGSAQCKKLNGLLEIYREIKSSLLTLRTAIIDNPREGLEKMFVKDENSATNFYELIQVYKEGVDSLAEKLTEDNFNEQLNNVFHKVIEGLALPEAPENIDHIRIMSLHASKGLSAKFVILCSMIDDFMPNIPSKTPPEQIPAIIQEQRRLFYVAITRCKDSEDYSGRLIISSFLSIPGTHALQMGIKNVNPKGNHKVYSTRFIGDFQETAPKSILGTDLL